MSFRPIRPLQAIPILFLFGALAGTFGDAGHVLSQTLGYPDSSWPAFPRTGQPLWVPLLMGSAGVSMGLGQWLVIRQVARWRGRTFTGSKGIEPKSIALWTGLLLTVWFLSGFLPWQTGQGRDLALASIAIAVWVAAERTALGLALAAVTAVLGTAVELAMVASGKFYYLPEHSNLTLAPLLGDLKAGVPTWLPSLYVVASVCAWRVSQALIEGDSSEPPAS